MPPNKTKPTETDVNAFLHAVTPEEKKQDCQTIYSIMKKVTAEEGILWGDSIIGFGSYQYRYKSGRIGDWFIIGFSPRKNALTLYLYCDLNHDTLPFENLGKHSRGKGCLYIKSLKDINLKVLEAIVTKAVALTKQH